MNGRKRVAVALLAVVLAAACDDNPVAPGGPFLGTWAGPVMDSAAGAGLAQLVLTQSGAGVSGTFTMTFSSSVFDRSGTVSGTAMTTTAASMFLTPSTSLPCGLSGTMGANVSISGTKLTGNYSAVACSGAVTGTLDLTRQ